MKRIPWKDQIADGRVFQLRSASKRYPPPCALIINATAPGGYGEKFATLVDAYGVVGSDLHARLHNPAIFVDGLRRDHFNGSRVVCRRLDLERFDADDIALIRYGVALDFNGRLHGYPPERHIPLCVPAQWTVFWTPPYAPADGFWSSHLDRDLTNLLRGAWYFHNHGGPRHLGYKYGDLWATRHTGLRLRQIREFLRAHRGDIIEQPTKVVRWEDSGNIFTAEIRRDCPALGGRWISCVSPDGSQWRMTT